MHLECVILPTVVREWNIQVLDPFYYSLTAYQTCTVIVKQSSAFYWKLPSQSSGHGLLPCNICVQLHLCSKNYHYHGNINKNGTWSYLHAFNLPAGCETNILNQPKPKHSICTCTVKITSFSGSLPKKEHLYFRSSNKDGNSLRDSRRYVNPTPTQPNPTPNHLINDHIRCIEEANHLHASEIFNNFLSRHDYVREELAQDLQVLATNQVLHSPTDQETDSSTTMNTPQK